jgi:FkbM family methyltransferase
LYSQNKEQEAILKYFGDFKGTFLDLGANNGEILSNTRALAELGWCGCLVEPSPKVFPKLKKLYEASKKGCFYVYNCAIGNTNGTAVLHDSGELLRTGDQALVSTLVEIEKKRFESVLTYEPVEVKVFRWKTFLNRLSIKTFDFVSVDCEGLDLDILKQMDIEALGVKCLCIEWNGNQELKAEFDNIMTGFKIIYTSGENLIYAR